MLNKALRVNSALFKDILKQSKKYQGQYFSLSIAELVGGQGPRVAVVVPGNLGLNAVRRNKLKRQMRSVIRLLGSLLAKSRVYLLFARPASRDLSFKDIEKNILELFKKYSNN